jgi:hypothetical protein
VNHSPLWQNLLTLAIVLGAAAYLGRRWWPAMATLLGRNTAGSTTGNAACGSGACKQCSSSGATPQKDHRIIIVRQRK